MNANMNAINLFPGHHVTYTLDGIAKTGTVTLVGHDMFLISADSGGDDLIGADAIYTLTPKPQS